MENLKERFTEHQLYDLEHKPRTVKMYVRRLGYAENLMGKAVHEITDDDLYAFKRAALRGELSIGRESVKGIMVAVRQFHIWGAGEKLWPLNGISHVRTIKTFDNLPEPLELDEVATLKAACIKPLEYRLIYLGLYTGMRIGEIAAFSGANWERDGWIRFRGEKNDKLREIPVHPDLEAVKWQVLAHPSTYDSTLQRVKRRLAKRTGVDFVAHRLRDTFSTHLYDVGIGDRIVKEMLGHAPDVTGRYVLVSRRAKQEAVARLPY